jgi:hypothetical protein
MAYFAGNCTYRYEAGWSLSYRCGWASDGQIACAGNDPDKTNCGGSASCSSTYFAANLCGASSSTPRRTINLTNAPGYHIYHKFLTRACECLTPTNTSLCFNGYFIFGGASIVNNATNARLTMTCLVLANNSWISSPLDTRNMYQGSCYLFNVKCYHSYLDNSLFSALGSTNSFWTNKCQPCL